MVWYHVTVADFADELVEQPVVREVGNGKFIYSMHYDTCSTTCYHSKQACHFITELYIIKMGQMHRMCPTAGKQLP
jgi:hypothetical protein